MVKAMSKIHWAVAMLLSLGLLLPAGAHSDELDEILQALKRGQYEEVISRTTDVIEAQEKPDNAYPYLRGMAAFRIAWFGQAEADLAPLADWRPADGWPKASEALDTITRSRELAPANVQEIRGGGAVLFRVYYDVADRWTQTLMNSLTGAHRVVSNFYGATTVETAVFVFADSERHRQFMKTLTGKPPEDWAWASGSNGMLIFCPIAPGNNYRESPDQLPETVAHELSHCLTHRVLGTAAMPMWLDEGLAMYCAGLIRPQKADDNDINITRLWTADQILPLRAVTQRDIFYDKDIAANAYVQAYAMVRFLVSELGRDGLLQLLNQLKGEGKFESAMAQTWDGGLDAFYEDWLAATERHIEKFKG